MGTITLQDYEQEHGCFPPAYVPDENGRPMHSWRVLSLPYLEEPSLYYYTTGWIGAFADGSVKLLNNLISRDALEAATTVGGGEDTPTLSEAGMVRRYVRIQPTISLIIFTLVVVAPLFWLPAHVHRQQVEKAQRTG